VIYPKQQKLAAALQSFTLTVMVPTFKPGVLWGGLGCGSVTKIDGTFDGMCTFNILLSI
jgi:hypothetical protein